MKKLFLVVAMLALSISATIAQNPTIKPQGGLFLGAGKNAVFVGFLGPKISLQFELKKIEIELGLLGSPGILLQPETRLGLVAGPFCSIARTKKSGKIILACPLTFVTGKTTPLPGIGVQF